MQFHENLKRICNEKGTSPTSVLINMGVATSKIAAWNKGALPKQEMLERLAEYLHCRVADFFWDGTDDSKLPERSDPIPADEDEADMLKIYRSLSRKDKHAFMAAVYQFQQDE